MGVPCNELAGQGKTNSPGPSPGRTLWGEKYFYLPEWLIVGRLIIMA